MNSGVGTLVTSNIMVLSTEELGRVDYSMLCGLLVSASSFWPYYWSLRFVEVLNPWQSAL